MPRVPSSSPEAGANRAGARSRAASVVRSGASAAVLLALMFGGSLVLWVGLPLAWVWIGAQVEGASGSLGAGVGTALLGFVASALVFVPVLGWLANLRNDLRVARGLEDTGHLALEVVMVLSAGLAVVGFAIWFFGFAGAQTVPLF